MSSPRFNSVEEYLASVDPTKARTLRSVIDLILAEFPELESKISWNVPTIQPMQPTPFDCRSGQADWAGEITGRWKLED